jgi:membrane protein YdbS with pleckstrin-like domain
MLCPQCGAEVMSESVFCHKCGHRLADPVVEPVKPSSDTGQPASAPADKFRAAAAALDTAEQPEQELWRGGYSPRAMLGAWCLSALVTVVLLIIGALWVRTSWVWVLILLAILCFWVYNLVMLTYRRWNVRYLLTNQRFVHESGILRRVTDRIEVLDMDDITFEQSFIERLVGVGTIRIISSDRSHPELLMYGIDNVRDVSGLFDDTRRAERRRRGLHIESI